MSVYRRNKSNTSSLALVMGIGLAAVIAAGSVYLGLKSYHRETFDKVTLCPSTGPKGQYVVLIDNTSPFPFTQKAALKQRLKNMVVTDLPAGAMLTVFLLGEDFKHNSEPVFEKCNPGQWSDGEGLTKTKKFVDKDFNEKFFIPLEAVVNRIPLDVRGKTSPIFEMLQMASISGFGHQNAGGEKHLIIFSDMAANTSDFSMYRNAQLNYKDFVKTSYYSKAIAPALAGVSVRINMMAAEPNVTSFLKRSEFWAQYFSANGADLESVDPMEGL
jgi:hypothetical protein